MARLEVEVGVMKQIILGSVLIVAMGFSFGISAEEREFCKPLKSNITIQVDDAKFSKYDLVDLAKAGAAIIIDMQKTTFSKYDMKDIMNAGQVCLKNLDPNKLNKSDLIDLVKTGIAVRFITSETTFSKYDLKDVIDASASVKN